MPVDVDYRSLARSRVRLRDAADQVGGEPSYLLRFYAVECGLKAAIMRRQRLSSTSGLDRHLRSHNLRQLAKALNLNANAYQQVRACRRRAHDQPPVEAADIHQAWRYGAIVDDKDEQQFVEGLGSLERWCGRELDR